MTPSLPAFGVRLCSLSRLRIASLLSLSFKLFICCISCGKRDSQRYDKAPAMVSGDSGKTRFLARQQTQHHMKSINIETAKVRYNAQWSYVQSTLGRNMVLISASRAVKATATGYIYPCLRTTKKEPKGLPCTDARTAFSKPDLCFASRMKGSEI
jgi:hypothetical protein